MFFNVSRWCILIIIISTCKVEGQSPARDTVPGVASHSDSSHFRFFHPSQNNAKFECYKKPLTCQLPAERRGGEGHWKGRVEVMERRQNSIKKVNVMEKASKFN